MAGRRSAHPGLKPRLGWATSRTTSFASPRRHPPVIALALGRGPQATPLKGPTKGARGPSAARADGAQSRRHARDPRARGLPCRHPLVTPRDVQRPVRFHRPWRAVFLAHCFRCGQPWSSPVCNRGTELRHDHRQPGLPMHYSVESDAFRLHLLGRGIRASEFFSPNEDVRGRGRTRSSPSTSDASIRHPRASTSGTCCTLITWLDSRMRRHCRRVSCCRSGRSIMSTTSAPSPWRMPMRRRRQ